MDAKAGAKRTPNQARASNTPKTLKRTLKSPKSPRMETPPMKVVKPTPHMTKVANKAGKSILLDSNQMICFTVTAFA